MSDFRHEKNRASTTLSSYIWSLKDEDIPYDLEWQIMTKASPYNPASKTCHLCNTEIFYILRRPDVASLNKRSEIMNKCRHQNKFKLCNI